MPELNLEKLMAKFGKGCYRRRDLHKQRHGGVHIGGVTLGQVGDHSKLLALQSKADNGRDEVRKADGSSQRTLEAKLESHETCQPLTCDKEIT